MYVILKALVLLGSSAVYSVTSQLNLSPVFGATGPSVYHDYLFNTAVLFAWTLACVTNQKISYISNCLLALASAQSTIQYYLYQYSGRLGPVNGPLLIELLTCFPVIFLSHYLAATALSSIASRRYSRRTQHAGFGVASYLFFVSIRKFSASIFSRVIGSSIIFTRIGLEVVVVCSYALILPSKALLLAALPFLHTLVFNTHLPLSHTTARLNATLHTHSYSLLARQESLTGYISVLENLKDEFRVLRCDHSLLGGDWTVPQTYPSRVKEPIYSIFVMLEAVRLVEVPEQDINLEDHEANALVM